MKANQRSVMPLQGPPPAEIALPRAPLVSVVAQVRFQMHLPIRDPQRVAAFQEAIADRYPHLEPQNVNVMMLSMQAPQQMVQPEFVIHWRFSDLERNWRITLTPEFITLDTRAYQNRADFSERFEEILQALEDTLRPRLITRLGMRFINQIKAEHTSKIDKLLRSEVLGVAGASGGKAKQLLTELLVDAEPGELLARWGKLPANVTVDPNLLPSLQEETWLLDLDVSKTQEREFDTTYLIATAKTAAERVYAIFRWMVTDDFLRLYGGEM